MKTTRTLCTPFLLSILTLGSATLVGCDDTVSKKEDSKMNSDGSTKTETETVKKASDGSMKTEKTMETTPATKPSM